MTVDIRPLLRANVQFSVQKNVVVADVSGFLVKIESKCPEDVLAVLHACDGSIAIHEISEITGVSRDDVAGIVSACGEAGLILRDLPRSPTVDGKELLRVLQQRYSYWNDEIFGADLWIYLMSGKATDSLVNGWLQESFHFIRGAASRLAYAASLSADRKVTSHLLDHHLEEYDHYAFFSDAIARRGVSVSQVPLPGTEAVINSARAAARRGALQYVACSGLLESSGSNTKRAMSFYETVERNFDKSNTGFVKPLLKHVGLDAEYQHGSICAEILESYGQIPTDLANDILNTARDFKDTLSLWFSDIYSFYILRPEDAGPHCRSQYRPSKEGFL